MEGRIVTPRLVVGVRYGTFEILAAVNRSGRGYPVRCVECGKRAHRKIHELAVRRPCRCEGGQTQTAAVLAFERSRHDVPAITWDTPFSEDLDARALVVCRGPLSTKAIGAAFGVSGERIRQVEIEALASLKRAFARCGFREADAAEWLGRAQRRGSHALADLPNEDPLS